MLGDRGLAAPRNKGRGAEPHRVEERQRARSGGPVECGRLVRNPEVGPHHRRKEGRGEQPCVAVVPVQSRVDRGAASDVGRVEVVPAMPFRQVGEDSRALGEGDEVVLHHGHRTCRVQLEKVFGARAVRCPRAARHDHLDLEGQTFLKACPRHGAEWLREGHAVEERRWHRTNRWGWCAYEGRRRRRANQVHAFKPTFLVAPTCASAGPPFHLGRPRGCAHSLDESPSSTNGLTLERTSRRPQSTPGAPGLTCSTK